MSECSECGADLQLAWKFCIFCGTPATPAAPAAPQEVAPTNPEPPSVVHVTNEASPAAPAATANPAIPSAIRPQVDESENAFRASAGPTFDFPLVLGLAIGVFGVGAMAIGFIILIGGS